MCLHVFVLYAAGAGGELSLKDKNSIKTFFLDVLNFLLFLFVGNETTITVFRHFCLRDYGQN